MNQLPSLPIPAGRSLPLHEFLFQNRDELIERCRARVAARIAPWPTPDELEHGVPLFLGQLIDALRVEQTRPVSAGRGAPIEPGSAQDRADMSAGATRHGGELHEHGFSVNQVVHDYGDLCQSITELAMEQREPVTVEEFRTLNFCLDQAIADAVSEFGIMRAARELEDEDRAMTERLGFLAHELRNSLGAATLSFEMIRSGTVSINGATALVVDRNLQRLRDLIDRALVDVRLRAGMPAELGRVDLAGFVSHVQVGAELEARSRGCSLRVSPVEAGIQICADTHLLFSALSNLLQNAFKYTHAHSQVSLRAYRDRDRVRIEVEDQCGGLPPGQAETLFEPFGQHSRDRTGLGLGLSISQRAVEACGGTIAVRDLPGVGCVFTMEFPLLEPKSTAAEILPSAPDDLRRG